MKKNTGCGVGSSQLLRRGLKVLWDTAAILVYLVTRAGQNDNLVCHSLGIIHIGL